ncbi:MAG: ACT domain-containing protein [Halioglobus sp.]
MTASAPGETDLSRLLARLSPLLLPQEFVFCCVAGGSYGDFAELAPLAAFHEAEGLTLLLPAASAAERHWPTSPPMRCISLGVQSSLEAVGLTAAVASALAAHGIAANVVAAFHHDHLFVPAASADDALAVLQGLSGEQ